MLRLNYTPLAKINPLILLCLLTFWAYLPARAQSGKLSFDHLTVKDGLPVSDIYTVLQDKFGYIWIGTQNGLVKYDGYETKVYQLDTGNTAKSTSTEAISIFEDKDNVLWVSTIGNGLFEYNRNTDSFIHYPYPQVTDAIISKKIKFYDNKGNLWLLSAISGKHNEADKFDVHTKRFEVYNFHEKDVFSGDGELAIAIYKDVKGNIWLGGDNGLYRYSIAEDRFENYLQNRDNIVNQFNINDIYEAASHPCILWLNGGDARSGTSGVVQFNTKNYR